MDGFTKEMEALARSGVVFAQVLDFPACWPDEQLVMNHDGTYTVFLNARCSVEAQQAAYMHALRHILRGDFARLSVQEIEAEAHWA